jgi:hypothetical protein
MERGSAMKRFGLRTLENPLQLILTSIQSLIEPFFYFWPWLASVLVFAAFLHSSQGNSLAVSFSIEPIPTWIVLGGLGFHLAITTLGCWFSALAATSFKKPDGILKSAAQSNPKLRMVSHAIWILLLSVTPVLAFALSTNSLFALYLASIWSLAVAAAAYLGLHSIEQGKKGLWLRSVYAGRRHRFYFAVFIALAATVPLAAGAIVATQFPLKLAVAGPLILALVGVSAVSTLIGAILIIVPLCLQVRWLGWPIAIVILVHAIYAPMSIDDENPLLRETRIAATMPAGEWKNVCSATAIGKPGFKLVDRIGNENNDANDAEEKGEQRPLAVPFFLVSAEGGGIRAAFWTAMGLGQMDLVNDDKFASRVISLSGVSGGSLGVATWLAAHEIEGLNPQSRLDLMADFLATDFLSPLIGGFFFLDTPRLLFDGLWPSARRDHVFEKAMFDRWMDLTGSSFFAQPIRRLCFRNFPEAPFVFFNTTDAITGRWVPLGNSNFHRENAFPGFSNALDHTSLRWISIAQAVSISARFPFLSPGAEVGITPQQIGLTEAQSEIDGIEPSDGKTPQEIKELEAKVATLQKDLDNKSEWPRKTLSVVRVATLVDGGYFDNSGLSHTIDAMEELNRHFTTSSEKRKYMDRPVYALHFSNDPSTACLPLQSNWVSRLSASAKLFLETSKAGLECEYQTEKLNEATAPHALQFLTTPLEAIFSVRGEHAASQREHLINRFFKEQYSRFRPMFPPMRQLKEFSLANELAGMYSGSMAIPIPLSNKSWLLQKDVIQHLYDEQTTWLKSFEVGDQKTPKGYFDNLDTWRRYAIASVERWKCAGELRTSQPPLGWTLSSSDRTLLRCLAGRATIRQGFPALTVPYTGVATPLPFGDRREPQPYSPMQ